MKYTPPVKGKAIRKQQEVPALAEAMLGSASLLNQIDSAKKDLIKKVDEKLEEADNTLELTLSEAKKATLQAEKAVQMVEELKEEAVELIAEIKVGPKGEDADEEAIEERVFNRIPKLDEEAIINKTLSRVPVIDEKKLKNDILSLVPKRSELKLIQERFEADPYEVIDKMIELPDNKFDTLRNKLISGDNLHNSIKSIVNQMGKYTQVSGGGFNNIYSGSTLVTDGLTGLSFTGSGVSSVTKASNGIVTVTISGGGGGGNITSINADTTAAQLLVVGTSGTDFAIADNGTGTHTFNLPTASATNRGALSSADWSTFNGKQGALSLTTTGSSGAATLIGNTLNIPQYSGGGTPGGSDTQVQFNDGGSFGGDAGFTYDKTNDGLTITKTALGTTQNDSAGYILTNTTAAANGAQQISPALRLRGNAWKSGGTPASHTVDFRTYVLPIQGASTVQASYLTQFSRNGGAYSTVLKYDTDGGIFTVSDPGSAGTVAINASVARVTLNSGSDTNLMQSTQTSISNGADGITVANSTANSSPWLQATRTTANAGAFNLYSNNGSPEGMVVANHADICIDTDNGDLYIKDTDSVDTGWQYIYHAEGTDIPVTDGGTGVSAISAKSIWVANSANTITEVTPGAGQSIRINAGNTAWEAYTPGSGGGDVTKVGTPVNNQIGVWTGDGTIEGDAALTFDTSTNTLSLDTGIIKGFDTTGAPGSLQIKGGDSTSSGNGGAISIIAGVATGTNQGGAITITSGFGGVGTNANGGDITIGAGSGAVSGNGVGGRLTLHGGANGDVLGQGTNIRLKDYPGNTAYADLSMTSLTGGKIFTFPDFSGKFALTDAGMTYTATWEGTHDYTGAISLALPVSATPTVNANGEIAFDTTVTDFSTGVLKFYGNEEQGIVAMPIAQFTSPTNGYVVAYNSTNDEFELQAPGGSIPTQITVANEAADTTCFPLFVTAATGDLGPKTNAGLAFNSSTGILTATGFSGPLTGNVTGTASGNLTSANIVETITNGVTTNAPSENAVFDALALKAPLTSPTFATSITGSYLTASEIVITDGSKNIVSAPVATYPSLTELTYLKGVTSAIQTQLNGKAATLSGTNNEIAYFNSSSTISSLTTATYPSLTELSYVKGVTSAIQTQLGTKAPTTSPTFATSITGSYLTASEILITDGSKNIVSAPVATYPSLTELSYVKGVTSAIQTQLNALANGMIYKGNWDASAGTFPGGGVAQTGWFYTVSVAGTVDSVSFEIGDRLIATTNNASTTVYAGNWTKLDATDAVTSVFSRTGNVVATAGDYTASQITNVPAGNIAATTVQAAINELDSEKQATGNYITALTGDGTASGPGSVALTLATVNSNVGSFTNASITVNAKGLITAASSGGAPTTITVANEASDTTCFPAFFTAATGDLAPKTNAGLTFDSSTAVLTATGFSGPLTGNVTGNVSGTAATVTGAAQTAITSLGTLTALDVDNININGNTISATSGAINITPFAGSAIVLDGTISVDAGVVTGITSLGVTGTRVTAGFFTDLTVTNAISGSITGNAGTASAVAVGGITGLGTGVATALAVNVGSSGAFVTNGGALGTPSSGTVTNLTGTASININGTVGATTPATGAFTTLSASSAITASTTIELGHASDTTLSRVSAGVMAVEGVNVLTVAGGTMTGNITLGENTSIAQDPSLSADGKYTGETITGTAGAALAFGDLIYLDPTDSRWELADANATLGADGDARGILGICVLAAAGDGSATNILLRGFVRADAAFPTLTVNGQVYVSENAGDITMTQPSTSDAVIRVVGQGFTADTLYFNPSPDYITFL